MVLIKDHKRYGPVGRCIYCGACEQDGLLSREHIIPSALNGNLILPDASCEACRGITHAYEGHCAHEIYGPARARMGFQSRNKAKKPTTYSFEVGSGAAAQILEVPVNEMPVWLPEPGI